MNGKEYEKELEKMIGVEKGYMKVIDVKKDGRKSRLIIYCACGKKSEMKKSCFLDEGRSSCGCRYGVTGKHSYAYKHGCSKTRLNNLYHSIKERCYTENCSSYKNYGGRGITVCDEWLGKHGFENFSKWALENGYDENAKRGSCTLDRIDVNGNYEPSNCRFISNKEQCNNKRNNRYIEMDGERLTFKQWCDKYNISPGAIYGRMKKGMDFETAIKKPKRKTCKDMSADELAEYKKKRAEQSKQWIKENKEYVYKKKKEWKKNNIEKVRASKRKYEENKKNERSNKRD